MQVTVTAVFGNPGFAAKISSRIRIGDTVLAFRGLCKVGGIRTAENAARAFPKYSTAVNPAQTPCFAHSCRISLRLGMMSVIFSTNAFGNVCELVQFCGHPRSYCGHNPCRMNSYRRCPPHCAWSRSPAADEQYRGDHDIDSK